MSLENAHHTAVETRLAQLPAPLQAHVARARAVGRDLAPLFNADAASVDLALASHDLFRAVPPSELLALAGRFNEALSRTERAAPTLLHGPVAADWLEHTAGVQDPSVLKAVRYHTTFAPALDAVAFAVFLSDKIDPDKVRRRPALAAVREAAYAGRPVQAAEMYLCGELAALISRGRIAHPRALEALNWLMLAQAAGAEVLPYLIPGPVE